MSRPDIPKQVIKRLESEVQRQHGVEISVYGFGSQGLEKFKDYLYHEGPKSREVEKRSLEYVVYLSALLARDSITPLWGDDDTVHYQPSQGSNTQSAKINGIFSEPSLPRYDADEYWSKYEDEYTNLLELGTENQPQNHVKPDILITDPAEKRLPWGADSRPTVTDEAKLKRWVSRGKFDKAQEALQLDEQPESVADWYSAISKHGRTKSPDEDFHKWEKYKQKTRYLVEIKHRELTKEDYSQILWYALVYDIPTVVVSGTPVSSRSFYRDLDQIPVETHVIDDIQIQSINEAQALFGDLFHGD